MGTADYNVIEMGRARARIERGLDRGERFADLKAELAHDMREALAGRQGWLATTVTRQGLGSYAETLQSAPEAVQTALECEFVQGALQDVLDGSRCLLVASLRQRLSVFLFRELGESVLSALDNTVNAAFFMQVLRVAVCPKVDALRDAIVAYYVDCNAERVADARGAR